MPEPVSYVVVVSTSEDWTWVRVSTLSIWRVIWRSPVPPVPVANWMARPTHQYERSATLALSARKPELEDPELIGAENGPTELSVSTESQEMIDPLARVLSEVSRTIQVG